MNKCSVCQSDTLKQKITYTQWYKGNLIAVENVTADICENCGEEYFSPDTVNKIQQVIESHNYSKTIEVPVFQLK